MKIEKRRIKRNNTHQQTEKVKKIMEHHIQVEHKKKEGLEQEERGKKGEKEKVPLEKEEETFIAFFLKNYWGTNFGCTGALNGTIFLFIAYMLYTSVDPSFSINTHYISDLGVGPNGAAAYFTTGIISICTFFILFHIYDIQRAKGLNHYRLLQCGIWIGAIFYFLGGFIAALFPVTHRMHTVGAFFYFLGPLLYYGGFLVFFSKAEYGSPPHRFLYASIFIGYLWYVGSIVTFRLYPEISGLISIYFIEWLTLFIHLPAVFLRCMYIFREKEDISSSEGIQVSDNNYNTNGKNRGMKNSGGESITLSKKHSELTEDTFFDAWKQSPLSPKCSKKQLVLVLIGLISISMSIYLGAIVIFIDHTFLYRVVLEWVINPTHQLGNWGVLLFLGVMVLQGLILPIPSELILISAGLIWGWLLGGLYGVIGLQMAAVLCYYIGKEGGRPIAVQLIGRDYLTLADKFTSKHGTKAILTARIIPLIPFDPISYIAGIAKWDFRRYTLVSMAGAVIRAYFFSSIGAVMRFQSESLTLETLSAVALEQQAAWFNFIFVIVCAILLILFIIYYKKWWSQ